MNATHDFGDVFEGEKLQHTFQLNNFAEVAPSVRSIKKDCACVVAALRRSHAGVDSDYELGSEIQGGDALLVTLDLNTTRRRGPIAGGVGLVSDRGTIELSVSAKANPYFDASPDVVDLGVVYFGDATERQVEMTSRAFKTFRVTEAEAGTSSVKTAVNPVDAKALSGDAAKWRATISIGPFPEACGAYTQVVRFRTDRKRRQNDEEWLEIPVLIQARVCGVVAASSDYVSLAAVKRGATAAGSVELRSLDRGTPLSMHATGIAVVATDGGLAARPDSLRTSLKGPEHDGDGAIVGISFDSSSIAPGPFSATIELSPDSPKGAPVRVRVFGVVLK